MAGIPKRPVQRVLRPLSPVATRTRSREIHASPRPASSQALAIVQSLRAHPLLSHTRDDLSTCHGSQNVSQHQDYLES